MERGGSRELLQCCAARRGGVVREPGGGGEGTQRRGAGSTRRGATRRSAGIAVARARGGGWAPPGARDPRARAPFGGAAAGPGWQTEETFG